MGTIDAIRVSWFNHRTFLVRKQFLKLGNSKSHQRKQDRWQMPHLSHSKFRRRKLFDMDQLNRQHKCIQSYNKGL